MEEEEEDQHLFGSQKTLLIRTPSHLVQKTITQRKKNNRDKRDPVPSSPGSRLAHARQVTAASPVTAASGGSSQWWQQPVR